jgi:2-polyprenyl-3-methyl-5-hydroxy-6-metoxy-1,4-benzoquinol methylase
MSGQAPGDAAEELRVARTSAYENVRPAIQRHVPATVRRVLDLGCASGEVGAAIKARTGAEVVGIEFDGGYAERAREKLDRAVVADIEQLAGTPNLAGELGRFDCLIAGDVLEHTRDPWSCLRSYAALLDAGGTAIVSVPNVRFWETFWQLGVRGRWPRRASGIFDRDHLRWFTEREAVELVAQAGLTVAEVAPEYRLRPMSAWGDRFARGLGRTPLRQFFAFQTVVVGRRKGS